MEGGFELTGECYTRSGPPITELCADFDSTFGGENSGRTITTMGIARWDALADHKMTTNAKKKPATSSQAYPCHDAELR